MEKHVASLTELLLMKEVCYCISSLLWCDETFHFVSCFHLSLLRSLSLSLSCRTSLPSLVSVHVPPCACTMTAQLRAAPAHIGAIDISSQNALLSQPVPLILTNKHFITLTLTWKQQVVSIALQTTTLIPSYLIFVLIYIQKYIFLKAISWYSFIYALNINNG